MKFVHINKQKQQRMNINTHSLTHTLRKSHLRTTQTHNKRNISMSNNHDIMFFSF